MLKAADRVNEQDRPSTGPETARNPNIIKIIDLARHVKRLVASFHSEFFKENEEPCSMFVHERG